MKLAKLRAAARLPLVAVAALALAACDNPVEPEEHPEAGGVVILEEGTTNVLAQSIGNAPFDRALTVPRNGSLGVEIFFLDEQAPTDLSRRFQPDAAEGLSTRVVITDTGVVTFAMHGDHGDFKGQSVGTTTAIVELLHGDHADFRSGPLTISVVQ